MSTRFMTKAVTALAGGVLDWQPANGRPRSQWLAACPDAAVPLHSLTPAPLHLVEDSARLASSISAHLLMRGVASCAGKSFCAIIFSDTIPSKLDVEGSESLLPLHAHSHRGHSDISPG